MAEPSDIAQRAAEQASKFLDTTWPSDEQRVKEIIQSAIDEACAEKSAEIERLRRRLDLLEARILQLASDWAETSSDIRTSAKRVLPAAEVDGDSTGVAPLEDVVEMLVAKVDEWRRDCDAIEEDRDRLVVESAELERTLAQTEERRCSNFMRAEALAAEVERLRSALHMAKGYVEATSPDTGECLVYATVCDALNSFRKTEPPK